MKITKVILRTIEVNLRSMNSTVVSLKNTVMTLITWTTLVTWNTTATMVNLKGEDPISHIWAQPHV